MMHGQTTHTHTYTLQNKLKQPQYKVQPNEITTRNPPTPSLMSMMEAAVCTDTSVHRRPESSTKWRKEYLDTRKRASLA
jgi:hypothetical protein